MRTVALFVRVWAALLCALLAATRFSPVVGQSSTDCPCILKTDCQGGQFVPVPSTHPPGWACISGWGSTACPGNVQSKCYFGDVPNQYGNPQVGCCYPPDRCYLFAPTNGAMGSCAPTIPSGGNCSFSCQTGYVLDKPLSTCNQGWPSPQQCVLPPCQITALPDHAVGTGSCPTLGGFLPSGSSCNVACATGYTTRSVSCYNGVLSGIADACLESDCQATAPLNGGMGSCLLYTAAGHSCTLSCNAGYSLTPPGPTTCHLGTLQPSNQICGISCSLSAPAGGNLGQCPTVLASGLSCQMACPADLSLVGAATTCTDGTLTTQTCQRTCAVPSPAHGVYNNCPTTLAAGASCSIACNDGYAIVGAVTSCSDGSLTSQTCVPAPCPVLAPANGALNGCPASLPSGSSCTFSCNTGYTLYPDAMQTSCLAGVLTAQTCLTPEEIQAANEAKASGAQSMGSLGIPAAAQNALISILSTLGGASVAFAGWYWKRSNDARKRTQRRALAAVVFAHLPIVDADDFDSPTGQEFTEAIDALAARVKQKHPELTHDLLITHPRLPSAQLDLLGRAISAQARAAGLELNASTMPSILACILRCKKFQGALVSHFADEHMQHSIAAGLRDTLQMASTQAAFQHLATKQLQSLPSPQVHPRGDEGLTTSPVHQAEVSIEMHAQLASDLPRSDA